MTVSRRHVLQASAAAAAAGLAGAAVQDPAANQKPGVTKGRVRQSGVLWCYGGPLEELAALCVRLGVTAIDVVAPDRWDVLKNHGLACSLTMVRGGGFGTGRGLNREEDHEAYLEIVRQLIDRNAEAGFENILVFAGNRRAGLSDRQGLDNCAKALRQVVDYAEKKGQVIQMELLNSKRDHPGYMFDRTRWGVELVEKVGSDAFKLLYDIYHAQIMEGDVIATIREHHQCFGHYHTAGVPGRSNLDHTQELQYPAIMAAIAETGFKGFVGQEFRPKGDRVKAFTQAVEWCDV